MGGCVSQGFGCQSHWPMVGVVAERDVARCTFLHCSVALVILAASDAGIGGGDLSTIEASRNHELPLGAGISKRGIGGNPQTDSAPNSGPIAENEESTLLAG
jgi:hypothetical protein